MFKAIKEFFFGKTPQVEEVPYKVDQAVQLAPATTYIVPEPVASTPLPLIVQPVVEPVAVKPVKKTRAKKESAPKVAKSKVVKTKAPVAMSTKKERKSKTTKSNQ